MWKVSVGLVLAVCLWIFTPTVRAGGEKPPAPLAQQQWRIFPNSPFRRGADQEITARFTRQIEPLVSFFQPEPTSETETIADSLLDAKARNQFFRLESLLRLYRRAFPDLEKYLASVKEIEDGIGAYSYAVDSLKFAEDEFKKENQEGAATPGRHAEQEKALEAMRKKKA